MSITSIDTLDDLKIYLNNNKFFCDLYIRELNNSLKGNAPNSNSYIYFLFKSLGFLTYHILITLRARVKISDSKNIYLSPDFLFDEGLGFHRYWENLEKSIDLTQVEFLFFSNLRDRFFSKRKGKSNQIDSFFTLSSWFKLLKVSVKFQLLIFKIYFDFLIGRLKSVSLIKNIFNLGSLNDYFIYYLLNDFSKYKDVCNKKITLIGEFQFWELGLFESNSKKRFLYQHSGIRFNDPRIQFFILKNKKLNILVTSDLEKDYLQEVGFENVMLINPYRNNDLWINVGKSSAKQVFFGSLDKELDMEILERLKGNVLYKPHPTLESLFYNFKYKWNNLDEKIYPIVYSQSAISKNLLDSKVDFKVIFKKNFDMSLIHLKTFIENSKSYNSIIFNDYYLQEISPKK